MTAQVNENKGKGADPGPVPIPLSRWTRAIGRSAPTVWKWRRLGWLRTVNIASKQYVTPEAAAEFMRRAEAGEFARKAVTPQRKRAAESVEAA